MSARLAEKIAIVLGAGSSGPGWGNGKACAVAYAREGAKVLAVDLNASAAEETARIIRGEGGDCAALVADVTKPDELAGVVGQAIQRHGRIDILHNNVGLGTMGGVEALALEDWERVIQTNLTSAFLACRCALPVMVQQGSGAILNVSSIGGIGVARYPMLVYSVSKAALNHFTRCVALEYAAKGIRCNAILPGLIDTPMVHGSKEMVAVFGSLEAMLAARHAQSPTGRMGDAWDVAAAAVFLASDEAKYVNGVLLPVDGGLSCRIG